MFGISDLFQWRRFVSHILVRVLYLLIIVTSVLIGLAGVVSSLALTAISPFRGLVFLERISVTWKRSLHVGSNWYTLAG